MFARCGAICAQNNGTRLNLACLLAAILTFSRHVGIVQDHEVLLFRQLYKLGQVSYLVV